MLARMSGMRASGGQASNEYVALLALVAVAFTLAVGLTSGGIGARVLAGLQRGLCTAVGHACPVPTPVRADLEPCPLERRTRTERLSETIGVARLGSSGILSATRASDGGVTVTLAKGGDAGEEVGAGARLRIGHRVVGGQARGSLRATWTSGRSWRFRDAAAARDFVDRYGSKATIGGRLVDALRSDCSLLCDALRWRPHPQLPPPDEVYAQAGATATLAASLGDGAASAEGQVDGGAVLGRRTAADGGRTWYLALDASATAGLGLPLASLDGMAGGEGIVSYAVDAHGHPATLAVQLAGRAGAGVHAIGRDGAATGRVSAMRGGVVELEATLDLADAANLAAAHGVLDALTHAGRLPALPGRIAALGRRFAAHGEIDRRTYALRSDTVGAGAVVGLGVELGAGLERTTEGLHLLDAETRLPGLPFLPRDDCRPA
jgi:hypothetical protein